MAINFCKSFGTISIYFRCVLHAISQLHNDYIRPPSLENLGQLASILEVKEDLGQASQIEEFKWSSMG